MSGVDGYAREEINHLRFRIKRLEETVVELRKLLAEENK